MTNVRRTYRTAPELPQNLKMEFHTAEEFGSSSSSEEDPIGERTKISASKSASTPELSAAKSMHMMLCVRYMSEVVPTASLDDLRGIEKRIKILLAKQTRRNTSRNKDDSSGDSSDSDHGTSGKTSRSGNHADTYDTKSVAVEVESNEKQPSHHRHARHPIETREAANERSRASIMQGRSKMTQFAIESLLSGSGGANKKTVERGKSVVSAEVPSGRAKAHWDKLRRLQFQTESNRTETRKVRGATGFLSVRRCPRN